MARSIVILSLLFCIVGILGAHGTLLGNIFEKGVAKLEKIVKKIKDVIAPPVDPQDEPGFDLDASTKTPTLVMYLGTVIQAQDIADFASKLDQADEHLVVISFLDSSCEPCQLIEPLLDELAEEFPQVLILTIDLDKFPELIVAYNLLTVPTFILVKNDKMVGYLAGTGDYEALRELIERNQ